MSTIAHYLRIFLYVACVAVGLYVAAKLPGIEFSSATPKRDFLFLALIFIVVNSFIGPFLRALSLPLRIITLGLFSLVLNALLFLLVAWISKQFGLALTVDGFFPALFGGFVVGLVAWVLQALLHLVNLDL